MSDSLRPRGLVACQVLLCVEFSRQEIVEWVAVSYSRGSSQPRDQTSVSCISCTGRQILHHYTTWEAICNLVVNESRKKEIFDPY